MKKIVKVILPPFVGFAIYFLVIRYSSFYFSLRIDEMGGGNLLSYMAFYRYLLPLLFLDAVITQLLIVVPLWSRVSVKSITSKVLAGMDLFFICLLFAFGIGYAIWDVNWGIGHLVKTITFLTFVQLLYWTINVFILKLLK